MGRASDLAEAGGTPPPCSSCGSAPAFLWGASAKPGWASRVQHSVLTPLFLLPLSLPVTAWRGCPHLRLGLSPRGEELGAGWGLRRLLPLCPSACLSLLSLPRPPPHFLPPSQWPCWLARCQAFSLGEAVSSHPFSLILSLFSSPSSLHSFACSLTLSLSRCPPLLPPPLCFSRERGSSGQFSHCRAFASPGNSATATTSEVSRTGRDGMGPGSDRQVLGGNCGGRR